MFAYEWCSAVYENREYLEGWENLLLVCLELGFRHLDAQLGPHTDITLTHTEHHRGLVDVVFKSQKGEAIADLLHAWTLKGRLPGLADALVGACPGHLVALHNLVPFSLRLRQLAIRFVEIAYCGRFKGAGVEKLVELLDHLHVTVEEMQDDYKWTLLLFNVIRSPGEAQLLSDCYWEFLVEFSVLWSWRFEFGGIDALEITNCLIDAQEWGKLECWIGIIWMSSESAVVTEKDLEHPTLLLLRQRPGAAQKLEQWMERWSKQEPWNNPGPFQRILTRAHEALQEQVAQ